jgi:hypothetical protein
MPPPGPPPGPPGPPPPPVDEPIPDAPARPGWRTVVKRPEPGARRKGKAAAAAAAAAATPPPPPPPAIEAARPEQLPSWAQWRRKRAISRPARSFTDHRRHSTANPNLQPTVRGPTPSQAVVQAPPRQGLFGTFCPCLFQVSFVLTYTRRARNTSAIVSDSA